MNIVAIICARSGSSRFPNKMMAKICGKPLLKHVVDRTRSARLIDHVVIATVNGDEAITDYCRINRIRFSVGRENDILDRIYIASYVEGAELIVRVWGDSPLVDPDIVDKTICYHILNEADYTYSFNHPLGQNVAVITPHALKKAWYEIRDENNRLWFHKYMTEQPKNFRVSKYDVGIGYTDLNYSIDTKEDIEKVEKWYEQGCLPDGRKIL